MINWKIRYSTIFSQCPELLDPTRRILEVGSGTNGIASYTHRHVVGLDQQFDGLVNPWLKPVRGTLLALPFSSATFDDVLCVDTLEHLARADRALAIDELVRVARRRVIISGPSGLFAQWGDAAYADILTQATGTVPTWLAEHQRYGIPALGELLDLLFGSRHKFTIQVNEGALQHYSGLLADNFPFMARFRDLHEQKFPLEQPLGRAIGDVPYSYLVILDVEAGRSGLVRPLIPAPSSARNPTVPKVEIYAVGHSLDRMPEIPGIQRILAGAASSASSAGSRALADDTGDSISDRNAELSEMTAIYWAWKNLTGLDAIGFCHYRRYFDFRIAASRKDRETRLRTPDALAHNLRSMQIPTALTKRVLSGAVVVAFPIEEGLPNAEQYMSAHVADDYLAMVNYVGAEYPHLAPSLVAHARDYKFNGNNMFIMRWAEFDQLCQFWFDCLLNIDPSSNGSNPGYQRRMLAFLSERLLDIYLRSMRTAGFPVDEYPIFFLEDTAFAQSD